MIREATYSSLRLGFYDPIKNLLAPHVKGFIKIYNFSKFNKKKKMILL